MNKLFLKSNLSVTTRICLSGLLIALATILQKVIAINYIPVIPFLRISLGGPAVIIFASILLGPWCGLLVGAASDLLGYFIFDASGMGFFPQVTLIYALLGVVPYFIFSLFRLIKNKKAMAIIEGASLLAVLVGSSLFIILNDSMKLYGTTYELDLWVKIVVPVALFIMLTFVMIFTILFDKKLSKEENKLPLNGYQISLSLFVIELLVMVIFGTLMKGWAFGFATYPAILICQIITLFFNVPLNTVLISILMKATRNRFNNINKEI